MQASTSQDNRRSLLKYTALFGSVSVINMLSSLVRNKCTAYFLGPSGVGLLALYNAFIVFMRELSSMGLPGAGVCFLADSDLTDEEQTNRVAVFRTWIFIAALLGLLLTPFFGLYSFSERFVLSDYFLLALIVFLGTLYLGEQVVLKSFRQLTALGRISVIATLSSLLIAIPLYFYFGASAILWVILGMQLVQLLLSLRVTIPLYPYHIALLNKTMLRAGHPLLQVSIAMVFAAVVNAGVDYGVKGLIQREVGDAALGLYNAAIMLAVTYMGMVLSSIDHDYYAKLTQLQRRVEERTTLVNDQIHVALLILTPLICGMLAFLPILIPLLFTAEFSPSQSIVQGAILFIFLKPILLPLSYLALVCGDLRRYISMDIASNIFLLALSFIGLRLFGIVGVGIALSLSSLLELLLIGGHALYRYKLRLRLGLCLDILLCVLAVTSLMLIGQFVSGLGYWLSGICVSAAVAAYSLYRLHVLTGFFNRFLAHRNK